MRRAVLCLLFLSGSVAWSAEPSKFTLAQSGGASADPLTVLGPAAACVDNQVARWNGASNTALQCSVLTVDDTTGNITAPGALTISTAGSNGDITLDPHGTGITLANSTLRVKSDVASALTAVLATEQYFITLGDTSFPKKIAIDPGYGVYLAQNMGYGWSSSDTDATSLGGGFTKIVAEGVGIVSQRQSTNQQTFRLYNTYTGASDYERLTLTGVAGTSVDIKAETAGTGADNLDIVLTPAGTGSVVVPVGTNASNPGIDFGGSGNAWLWARGSGYLAFGYGGNQLAEINATGVLAETTKQIGFYVSGNPGSSDAGFARSAAAVVKVTNGSTGIGGLLNARVVTPDIDGETTTAVQSGTVFTNTGDGDGEAITLLNDPGIGVQYCFAVDVAQTITVAPSTGEKLYYGTDECVVSLTSNSIGSTLCVTAITGGSGAKWFTMSDKGAWTCND